jgi:hypothetical protein
VSSVKIGALFCFCARKNAPAFVKCAKNSLSLLRGTARAGMIGESLDAKGENEMLKRTAKRRFLVANALFWTRRAGGIAAVLSGVASFFAGGHF